MQEQLKKNNYENEWKGLESIEIEDTNSINTCKKNVENSNPPNSGDVITNLDEYETNWISIAPIDCIKSNLRYFATYDFLGYNAHCAPTAGTNLLYYWYNRNNSKFSRLCYKNSWSQTFELFYKYMKTDNSGTGEDDMRRGMKQYLNKVGYSSSEVKMISFATWNDMLLEIDNGYGGYPFIFCVYDHYLYGDHAVLAVGYMEFEYKTKQTSTKSKYSRYLRIADGWSNGAERFVHVSVGHDTSTKGMITVLPKAN